MDVLTAALARHLLARWEFERERRDFCDQEVEDCSWILVRLVTVLCTVVVLACLLEVA